MPTVVESWRTRGARYNLQAIYDADLGQKVLRPSGLQLEKAKKRDAQLKRIEQPQNDFSWVLYHLVLSVLLTDPTDQQLSDVFEYFANEETPPMIDEVAAFFNLGILFAAEQEEWHTESQGQPVKGDEPNFSVLAPAALVTA